MSVVFATVIMRQRNLVEKKELEWEDLPLQVINDFKESLPQIDQKVLSRNNSTESIVRIKTYTMKESSDSESPKHKLVASLIDDRTEVLPHPFLNDSGRHIEEVKSLTKMSVDKPRPSETILSGTAVRPLEVNPESPGSRLAPISLRVKRSLFVPRRDDTNQFQLPSSGSSSPREGSSSPLHDPDNGFWELKDDEDPVLRENEVPGPRLPRKVKHVRDDIGAFRLV